MPQKPRMVKASANPDQAAANFGSRSTARRRHSAASKMYRPRLRSSARPRRYRSYASTLAVACLTRRPPWPSSTARRVRTLSAIARAISSWTSKISAISRSYRSDHTWKPLATSTSCTVTRTRLPDRRTLPSSTVPTLSFDPISARSDDRPLNENDDARAATRRPSICDSAFRISSASPSPKKSFPESALRL